MASRSSREVAVQKLNWHWTTPADTAPAPAPLAGGMPNPRGGAAILAPPPPSRGHRQSPPPTALRPLLGSANAILGLHFQ